MILVKNRLEHHFFCFDVLLLLFRRFIKGWLNGVEMDYANLINFGVFLIQVSPQIIEPPINQSVTEGNSVNFSCRASGVPTPLLVWVFNDAELPFGINRDGVSFLEFLSVTKGMEGSYKCIAENTANTTSSSATLRVYGKFNDNDDNDDDGHDDCDDADAAVDLDDDADDNHGDDDDVTLTLNCC